MRCPTLLSHLVLVAAMALVRPAQANESTTHRITSGSFGVAWIASEGLVYTWSPAEKAAPFRVNHLRAHQVAAIDFDGDGRDELAIIDALNKSLYVYDFDDKAMIGGFGSNVAEITVGRFHPDEPYESLVAATYSGHVFRWNKEVGNQGWIPLPGDFVKGYRGQVVPRIKTDGLVTVARGDVYTLNPVWKTYSQVLLGKDARVAIACDLATSPGDEIVVACGNRHDLFLCGKKTAQPLGQQGTAMTCGKFTTNTDTLLVVTPRARSANTCRTRSRGKMCPPGRPGVTRSCKTSTAMERTNCSPFQPKRPKNCFASIPLPAPLPECLISCSTYRVKPSTVALDLSDKNLIDGDSENVTLRAGSRLVCDCKFWNTTHKPYVIRMYTPSGRNLLRDSPADHIHHHGLMFAVSANDCDFWAEFPDLPQGKQELAKLSVAAAADAQTASRATATLLWKNAAGAEILQEKRTLEGVPYDAATLLTWSCELSKKPGEQVTLGGSHYFGLGMRFVESMDNGGVFRFSPDQGESTPGER